MFAREGAKIAVVDANASGASDTISSIGQSMHSIISYYFFYENREDKENTKGIYQI